MFRALLCFVALLPAVFAQYIPTVDKNSYSSGDTVKVAWAKSGQNQLKLDKLDSCRVLLLHCDGKVKGGQEDPVFDDVDIKDGSHTFKISDVTDYGPNGYYFLQMVAFDSSNEGRYSLSYGTFFEIESGMTGSGSAEKDKGCIPGAAAESVPGTASSSTVWTTTYELPASLKGKEGFDIPYSWQRGPTRTAPNVPVPSTKVTMTTTPSRRYPTSSYSPYKSYFKNSRMPVKTGTPSPTKTFSQHPNHQPTLATTPSGRLPTRATPTLSIAKTSSSTGAAATNQKRRVGRWARA